MQNTMLIKFLPNIEMCVFQKYPYIDEFMSYISFIDIRFSETYWLTQGAMKCN